MPSSWSCDLSNFRISGWKRSLKSKIVSSVILIVVILNAVLSPCKVKTYPVLFLTHLRTTSNWLTTLSVLISNKEGQEFQSVNEKQEPVSPPHFYSITAISAKARITESDLCWQSCLRGAQLQCPRSELIDEDSKRKVWTLSCHVLQLSISCGPQYL